jgi:hypothetical protein
VTDDLAKLRRWEDAGAHWQVLARHAGRLVIALQTCDTREEVDRLASAEADLLAYVGERSASDTGPAK